MSESEFPRVRPCGDAALTIELGSDIDAGLNARVLALDAAVAQEAPAGVVETIPTYRSLFVSYDPLRLDYATLTDWLLGLARGPLEAGKAGRHWRFPVTYGGAFGEDMAFVAGKTGLSEADVARRHAAGHYRVYMMGFMPGFTYLGGLDPALSLSRRDNPRLVSPAGTISIGGIQTGIQCLVSPTGWHLIGRTPARTYDPQRRQVFFLEPGDSVSFRAVGPEDFAALERRAEAGELVAEPLSS